MRLRTIKEPLKDAVASIYLRMATIAGSDVINHVMSSVQNGLNIVWSFLLIPRESEGLLVFLGHPGLLFYELSYQSCCHWSCYLDP